MTRKYELVRVKCQNDTVFCAVNPMQVKDLTIDELRLLIQETVTETIQALLFDPDEGKQIKPEVQQQLLDSLRRTQAGERGIPAEEVARKLGLNW